MSYHPTGRVPNIDELEAGELVWLLEVRMGAEGSSTLRWSSKPVQVDGTYGDVHLFPGGLDPHTQRRMLELFSDSPGETEASFTDLPAPDGLAQTIAEGAILGGAYGECSLWAVGTPWEARDVYVKGRLSRPHYGGDRDGVSFTIRQVSDRGRTTWPPAAQVLNGITASGTIRGAHAGALYQTVLGRFGDDDSALASRMLVLDETAGGEATTGQIAGHWVECGEVTITATDGTNRVAGTGRITLPVTNTVDNEGGRIATVDTSAESSGWRGASQHMVAWTGGPAFVANDPGAGATGVVGAGSVLLWLLHRAGVEYNRGAWEAVRGELDAYDIGCVIEASTDLWDEYARQEIIPLLPLSITDGPKGIEPVVWRYEAVAEDAIDHIERGPGVWRDGPVRYTGDIEGIENRFTLEYAISSLTNEAKARAHLDGGQSRIIGQESLGVPGFFTIPVAVEASRSAAAAKSQSIYGLRQGDAIQASVIWTESAAYRVLHWMAVAKGFLHRTVTYVVGQEYGHLRKGDVVTLTDDELGEVDRVALVAGLERGDGPWMAVTLQVVTNPATTKRTTGPNPDGGDKPVGS